MRISDWSSDVCSSDLHVAELEARARVRDAEWPVTAVDLVLAALIAFRPLEVGKHVLVGPAGIAELAPMVEVLALAADIDQPVDGTRPAEHAAARPVDAAPGQSVAGLGLVAPVGGGIVHRLEVADGDMDPGIPVARPRLQQKHAMAAEIGRAHV